MWPRSMSLSSFHHNLHLKPKLRFPPLISSTAVATVFSLSPLFNSAVTAPFSSSLSLMEKQDCIVLFPYPAMGHLISMVELGKRFIEESLPFTVVVLVADPPFKLPGVDAYVKTAAADCPRLLFLRLPPLPSFDGSDYYPPSLRTIELAFEFVRLTNPLLRLALQALSQFAAVRGLFLDLFGSHAVDVAEELGVPTYFFMASPAAQLAMFLYLPVMDGKISTSFKDMNGTMLHFPGLPPLPPADIPMGMEDRNQKSYHLFVELGRRMARAAGHVINSFDDLEPEALKALSAGDCVPGGPTPPVYNIGPLVAAEKGYRGRECLAWLDSQPSKSVVFLCFGSMFTFSREQLREMAAGLERSGQRFLWVVRCQDKEADLPEGFVERTRGRGLVWEEWAEQAAALRRDSVGAFVTHCGWNSVLEAVCAGVPMVAWPLYAEQRTIRVLVVQKGLGVSVETDERGVVPAAEVETRVREVMESERGRRLRGTAEAMKAAAGAAFRDDGSSQVSLRRLAQALKQA